MIHVSVSLALLFLSIPFPYIFTWCLTVQVTISAHSLGCELVPIHMLLPVREEMSTERVKCLETPIAI